MGRIPDPGIDRASATDLAFLAMQTGPVPEQFAVAAILAPNRTFDTMQAQTLLAERVAAIPRLRQRLVRPPPGCGRAIWVDDARFDIRRHVRHGRCPDPGDERALLDTVAAAVIEPLPRSRPLWAATFISGLADGSVAVLLVLHHVLADGMGGLAVLAGLLDPPPGEGAVPGQAPTPLQAPPLRPPPSRARLAADAAMGRLRAVARIPAALRDLRRSTTAAGGLAPTRAAACSLLQAAGPRRRLAVVRTDLADLLAAAHRNGCTLNDAVLAAIAGTLRRVLTARGESVQTISIAVPVATRRSATAQRLGTQALPMLVAVPTTGDAQWRCRQAGVAVRARKASATGPPLIGLFGPVFRVAAAAGAYRWYMRHQRRLHTIVSNVRGPDRPVSLAGAPVTAIIPVAVGEYGNVTVAFDVMSYAGTLAITAVADPDHFPDLDALMDGLQTELAQLCRSQSVSTMND